MSVQKFLGTIETDGIKDERGIETPSLSATGEVSGKTGVFSESVTAPVLNGKATSAGSADNATNAVNDGEGNNIPNTYATKEALEEETSARVAADETLSKGITAEATERSAAIEDIVDGTTVVGKAAADGNGNNIPSTYATQRALASGLAGKANTSGSYPNLSVGKATADGNGNNIPDTYAAQDGTYAGLTAKGNYKTFEIDLANQSATSAIELSNFLLSSLANAFGIVALFTGGRNSNFNGSTSAIQFLNIFGTSTDTLTASFSSSDSLTITSSATSYSIATTGDIPNNTGTLTLRCIV